MKIQTSLGEEIMLYYLSYADYEDYRPYLLEGPEVPNWEEYCDSILQEAAELAVQKEQANEHWSWVGWGDLIEAAVEILKTKGYKEVKPIETTWCGSGIIRDESDTGDKKVNFTKVWDHNEQVQKSLDVSHKAYEIKKAEDIKGVVEHEIDVQRCQGGVEQTIKAQFDYLLGEIYSRFKHYCTETYNRPEDLSITVGVSSRIAELVDFFEPKLDNCDFETDGMRSPEFVELTIHDLQTVTYVIPINWFGFSDSHKDHHH